MKGYDFLIVGTGLFDSVFANEAKKTEKDVSSLINENILAVISIAKISIKSMFIKRLKSTIII